MCRYFLRKNPVYFDSAAMKMVPAEGAGAFRGCGKILFRKIFDELEISRG
jgi:hypothetical protein